MGSPLSPIVSNLFMDYFEENALSSLPLKSKLRVRFFDDTFVIWPHGRESLNKFIEHLNSQSKHIKLTMEVEETGSLSFLNVLTMKKPSGSLAHKVFRKKTRIEQYLHASSHHHSAWKLGVLNTLATRAPRISDDEHLEEEKLYLPKVFKDNGYTKHQALRALQNVSKEHHNNDQTQNRSKVSLPYVHVTSNKIARILRKKNIGATFKPLAMIRKSLKSIKDPIDPRQREGVLAERPILVKLVVPFTSG